MQRRLRTDSRGAWAAAILGACLLVSLALPARSEDTSSDTSTTSLTEDDNRTIAIGIIDFIDVDWEPDPNVVVGDPKKLDVAPEPSNPRRFRVTPKAKGSTQVIIRSMNGKASKKVTYNVITNDLSSKVLTIRRLLQDVEGITIESVDDKIVIDGELVVPRDLDRILQVQDAYKDSVLNLVTLSKLSREAIAKRMQKEINDDPGGVNVTVRIINDTFFLFGKVDSSVDRDRAETIAQTYLPEMMGSPAIREQVISLGAKKYAIKNMIQVEEAPQQNQTKMVRITYHFVEIGKEYLKSSFFKWVPLLNEGAGLQIGPSTTGGVQSQTNGTFSGTITSLFPKLASASNGGFSRILFSTVQLTEDNTATELVRTEQIPFVGAVVNGVPVTELADTGITIKTTPKVDGDKVRLACSFQFKTAVGNGAGGRPQTVNTASQSQIVLKSGESAALGGLISSDASKTIDKDPEAATQSTGQPIFTLLRSKAFSANKSQFVIFVTPKIIDDASEGTADIKAKILNNKKRRRIYQ